MLNKQERIANKQHKINQLGVYLYVSLSVLVILAIFTYFKVSNISIKSLIYFACSGGIGGTLYSIRGFYQHVGKRNFDLDWTWWYIFRPLISMVVGVFAYFLIVGGLLNFKFLSENTYQRGIMFYLAISFLAGFCFSQFADNLENIGAKIFTKKKVYDK